MRAAIDPIVLFVVAIIIFNILSSFFAAAKRVRRRSALPRSAAPPPSPPAVAPRPSSAALSAARAAEMDRLRKALLASGALPQPDVAAAPAQIYATTGPPAAPPRVSPAPAAQEWAMLAPPTLMSLEPGPSAFAALGVSTSLAPSPTQATTNGTVTQHPGPGRFESAGSVANAFVAAAIVGPCAAFRPPGHMPGGW